MKIWMFGNEIGIFGLTKGFPTLNKVRFVSIWQSIPCHFSTRNLAHTDPHVSSTSVETTVKDKLSLVLVEIITSKPVCQPSGISRIFFPLESMEGGKGCLGELNHQQRWRGVTSRNPRFLPPAHLFPCSSSVLKFHKY